MITEHSHVCQVFKRLEHPALNIFNFYSFYTSRKREKTSHSQSHHSRLLTANTSHNWELYVSLIECLSTFEFRSTYDFSYFQFLYFLFNFFVTIHTLELTMTSAWLTYQSGPLGASLLDYMIYFWQENKQKLNYEEQLSEKSACFHFKMCKISIHNPTSIYCTHVYTY